MGNGIHFCDTTTTVPQRLPQHCKRGFPCITEVVGYFFDFTTLNKHCSKATSRETESTKAEPAEPTQHDVVGGFLLGPWASWETWTSYMSCAVFLWLPLKHTTRAEYQLQSTTPTWPSLIGFIHRKPPACPCISWLRFCQKILTRAVNRPLSSG